MTFQLDGGMKLLPGFRIRAKYTRHATGDHCHIWPMHSLRGHAFMSFDHDPNSKRLAHRIQAVSMPAVVFS